MGMFKRNKKNDGGLSEARELSGKMMSFAMRCTEVIFERDGNVDEIEGLTDKLFDVVNGAHGQVGLGALMYVAATILSDGLDKVQINRYLGELEARS